MTRGLNFSSIPASSPVGRGLRRLLGFIPSGTVVRVLQGPARGMKWVVGAQTHGMWLGSYEQNKQEALRHELKPGHVFLDIGANVGFYTLIASRLVGDGQVFAFEPLPRNLDILRRHVLLNRLANVTLVPKAVAAIPGTASFSTTSDCSTNRLEEAGDLRVEVTSVDAALEAGEIRPPHVIKIDVEGAELMVLRGATKCLRSLKPCVFVALHSEALYASLHDLVRSLDLPYIVTRLDGGTASEDRFVDEVVLRPAGAR